MAKTYIPEANDDATDLHNYLTRYQAKLLLNSPTSDQITALANLITCLLTFITEWPKPPPAV